MIKSVMIIVGNSENTLYMGRAFVANAVINRTGKIISSIMKKVCVNDV